jgi:hypothetical protein
MSDEAPSDEVEKSEPEEGRPRRKRRKRAEAEAVEETTAAEEKRPEVPAFARTFPREPRLDALVAAFEAGDYARVRREAPALDQDSEPAEVRAAARELRRRLDPDPLAAYLLGIAALLLTFLAGWYWLHPHAG